MNEIWLQPPRHPRIAGFDRQVAVAIGVNAYGDGINPLENAVGDATRIAKLLAVHHGYATHLLVDHAAEFDRLCRYFSFELPRLVTDRSQLLIYFAGHGVAHEDATRRIDGFLLPRDANRSGRNWLPMAFLRRWLDALPCHHLLLVLDCCFAGAFAQVAYRDVDADRRALFQEEFAYLLNRRSYHLLASAARDERAVDRLSSKLAADAAAGEHGAPFASAIIEAIGSRAAADGNGDGVVTVSELYGYVRRRLQPGTGVTQTPNLWPLDWHDAGEYLFAVRPLALAPAPLPARTGNPYRGLAHFEVGDAALFHGRDEIADQLAARAIQHRLVVLLGASGSGKSSVLHAGVWPRLTRAGVHVIGPVRPGASPLRALAATLAAHDAAGAAPRCLIVDQLDELISAGVDAAQRELIQRLLAQIVTGETSAAAIELLSEKLPEPERQAAADIARRIADLAVRSLVIALRSDMEASFVRGGTLGGVAAAAWQAGRTVLRPMNREQLRDCIVKPAAYQTFFFTDIERDGRTLVDALLDEVDQVPGALPLLSVALERMFDSCVGRGDRTIGWSDYPDQGGVFGALQDKANLVLAGRFDHGGRYAGPPELAAFRGTLRRILLRMVTVRGRENVRRPVFLSELRWDDPGENERVQDALDALRREGLVTRDVDPSVAAARGDAQLGDATPGAFVQPAHDALLTGWPELQQWIADDRHRIVVQRDLAQAVRDWLADGRSRALLWDDERIYRLDELTASRTDRDSRWHRLTRLWSIDHPIHRAPRHTYTADETAFIRASLRARRGLRLRIATAVSAAITALLIIASVAVNQRDHAKRSAAEANDQRSLSDVRALAYRVRSETSERLDLALLLAAQAYEHSPGTETETAAALLETLRFSPHLERMYQLPANGVSIALDPADRRIAVGLSDGRVAFLSRTAYSATELGATRAHTSPVSAVAFDSTGAQLASGSWDGDVQLWDAATRTPAARVPRPDPDGDLALLPSERHPIADLQIRAGTVTAVALDGWYTRWKFGAADAEIISGPGTPGFAITAALLGDQEFIAGMLGELKVWNAHRRAVTARFDGGDLILAVGVDPAHGLAVTGTGARTVQLWDLRASGRPTLLGVHDAAVTSVAISPETRLVASGSDDGLVRLWSLDAPGHVQAVLRGHHGGVMGLAFSRDGKHLAATGSAMAILWRIERSEPLAIGPGVLEGVVAPTSIASAADRVSVIVTSAGGQVATVARGEVAIREPAPEQADARRAAIPGSDRMVVATGDGHIEVHDVTSDRCIASAVVPTGEIRELAAQAGMIAAIIAQPVYAPGNVLWIGDILDHEIRLRSSSTVDRAGSRLALGMRPPRVAIGNSDGTVEVRDLATGEVWRIGKASREGEEVTALAFGDRGDLIAGRDSGHVAIYELSSISGTKRTPSTVELSGLSQRVRAVAIDELHQQAVAGGLDDRLLLWTTAGDLIGDLLAAPPSRSESIEALAMRPAERTLAVATNSGLVMQLELDPRAWQRTACALANRELEGDGRVLRFVLSLPWSDDRSCATINQDLRRARGGSAGP